MTQTAEKSRLLAMSVYERQLHLEGFHRIAGVDEAGRGPLAGPVVAAACILPQNAFFAHLNDSKQLTREQRATLFTQLTTNPNVHYGVSIIDVETIDAMNILRATLLGMQKAVEALPLKPDYLLIDGNQLPLFSIPAKAIIQGDALSISIAAASIIAKETRDQLMEELDTEYPQYNFKQHKGYATKAHMEAIRKFGPSPCHRKTFDPVKSMLNPPLLQTHLF